MPILQEMAPYLRKEHTMIYTVFTLSSPNNPLDVRFVGVTTQTVTKRLCDIVSVAHKPYCHGHDSFLSQWIREVGEPIATIILDTYDKEEASACKTSTFNSFVKTGRMLNSCTGRGRTPFLKVNPITDSGNIQGRQVNKDSDSAKYSLNRKQFARGEADFILRPNLV